MTVLAYYRPRRTSTVTDGGDLVEADMSVLLQPDVVVDNLPRATADGADAQLDAAVRTLLDDIARNLILYLEDVLQRPVEVP